MASDDDFEIFEEMDRRIHSMVEEAFSGIQTSLFDVKSKTLRPLFRIEVTDKEVTVTFDLPCVEKDDVEVNSTEETLSVEARMRKPVTLKVGGPFQRHVEFEKFSKKIRLPVKVEPGKGEAHFRNGMLTISFPVAHRGRSLQID